MGEDKSTANDKDKDKNNARCLSDDSDDATMAAIASNLEEKNNQNTFKQFHTLTNINSSLMNEASGASPNLRKGTS